MSNVIGKWCELENGWIVGPIVEVEPKQQLCVVKFGDGVWDVDSADYEGDSNKRIKRIGTKEELTERKR